MRPGQREDGADAFAEPLSGGDGWDLRCLIALTATGPKKVSSTDAMRATARTSPYYSQWVDSVARDLQEARGAVLDRDLERLGQVAERSCLRMHSAAISADPGIIFWNGLTIDLMHAVRSAREDGLAAFFTVDAGPHVKVFCAPQSEREVESMLRAVAGVERILITRPGPGVTVRVDPS